MSKTDYDLSKIKAFVFDVDGVLSPSTVNMGPDGMPARMVNVKDGYALQLAARLGYRFAIISGAASDLIRERFRLIGVSDVFTGVNDKLPVLKEWLRRNDLKPEETVYCGDDIPDYECMIHVGLSVAPADAAIDIRNIARYISPVNGGYGVARDIIEQVMRAQGRWLNGPHAFNW